MNILNYYREIIRYRHGLEYGQRAKSSSRQNEHIVLNRGKIYLLYCNFEEEEPQIKLEIVTSLDQKRIYDITEYGKDKFLFYS
jgi:hypothetical protein